MQKINRENLKDSLVRAEIWRPSESAGVTRQDYDRFVEAARLLLEITAPDYMPSDEMDEAGEAADNEQYHVASMKDIFRAMVQELIE